MAIHNTPAALALAVLVTAVAAPLAGCQSPDPITERSQATRGAIQAFRDGGARALVQVHITTSALAELVAMRGDMQETYANFDYAVANVEKQAKLARERTEDLRVKRNQFIEQWEKELTSARDPDVKGRMTRDRADSQKDFDRLMAVTGRARDAYNPWIEGLRKIREGLAGDSLKPEAIAALRAVAATTQAHGAALQAEIQGIIFELDRMARLRAARLEP